ncbi:MULTISPECIES: MarR family winged helix-turn-helix transcriptional regulator [unclassified Pseudomonas]|jgi:DNA-binding MarR family transcriptional regulator|uniref:MarR family winged helix-turn-helix transcriptional regulator n=1 Tax=unclassified Pseudomonas TaxID=196821 RepID=UPI000F563EA1|nr:MULTISPECIES: MarR family transcriptional regulator [unclassified Pseudomonas]AZF36927.1 Transcriptional regulator, MarR family [Pseudomonas sp. R4-39-08]AZF52595.1 Transcriptional regulator, MarR family [Pseudomonas sp. R4-34-07]AZF57868.1 Transcriptional regulator, MarR family [Pseudomonas sp. R11-23-07]
MTTKNKVQDTHISVQMKDLHRSLISIVSVMNRPRNDERLIAEAGVHLDQALFRLLVVIERVGPIGVVDLAGRLGRDYTTISRQVSKLERMELVIRHENSEDRRMREAVVSEKGKAVTDKIDQARERLAREIFQDWAAEDITSLVRLMRQFAQALEQGTEAG